MPDEVLFGDTWFAVTAVDGTGLFDPGRHGLEPRWIHTACWRGHICRYAVLDGQLRLRDLVVGSEGEPRKLGGVQPLDGDYPEWHYRELDIAVDYTGRLLIGAGDVDDRPYLNMGFRPAWMYSEVHDLAFRAGMLISAVDCSAELVVVRAEVFDTAARRAPGEPIEDWIARTFSLSYDYSWPR
ncbi:hypothetical protein DMH04_37260 [Kibdelosporangium aridum]|uniref:Uncharacterized protein n=2 Tax=Kibdelosporangium aridum TaxID=2030 RepID=A0A428YZ35_KIBAR|nr:hypothetical protein DMH04_37260 [Kibdelosporangium aridum]